MFYKTDKDVIQDLNSAVVKAQTELQEQVDEYLKNKDNSLEDRWEVWTKYSQKNHVSDIIHYPVELYDFEESIHDGDYLSRYETVGYNEILSKYEDYLNDTEELCVRVRLQEMKEFIMSQNLGGYKFDW